MMKKIVSALLINALMIALPLIMKPLLIFHYKILIIITGTVIMWLTQPALSVEETRQEKESDKFTVILILGMSFISVIVPVIQWAYFSDTHYNLTLPAFTGIFMIITGLIFRIWAMKTLGEYFTPTIQIKKNHTLITTGPYNIVRHPGYAGAFLCISGGAVLLESWIGFLVCILFMGIAYYARITLEERKLTAHFGTQYTAYKQKTRRMIPFIW